MHRILVLILLVQITMAAIAYSLPGYYLSDTVLSVGDYEDFITRNNIVWFSNEKIVFKEDFEEYASTLKFPSQWSIVEEGKGLSYQVLVDSPAIGSRSLQVWGEYGRKAVVSCNFTSISSPSIVGAYILDLLAYVDLDNWHSPSFFDIILWTDKGSITINASRLVRIGNEGVVGRLVDGWNRFVLVYNPWSGEVIYYVNIYTGHFDTGMRGARPLGLWIGAINKIYVDNIVLKEAYYTWLSSEWSTTPRGGVEYYTVTWSPRGDMLAFGSSDGRVYLYSREGKLVWEKKVNGTVTAIAWGSYGDRITVGNNYGLLIAFLPSGYTRWSRSLQGSIRDIAWDNNGLYAAIITSYPDKLVVVDSNGTLMLEQYLPYTPVKVLWASSKASENMVVVGFADGRIRAYNIKPAYGNNSRVTLLWEKNLGKNAVGLDYCSNTSSIIVALEDGKILSIDPVNANVKMMLSLGKPLYSLDCSPRGWITVAGERDIIAYSFRGEKLCSISFSTSILPLGGVIHEVKWDPNSILLAVAGYTRILVYRLEGLFPWYTVVRSDTVENAVIELDAHNTRAYNAVVKEYHWNFTGQGYTTMEDHISYHLNHTGILLIGLTVKAETLVKKNVFSTMYCYIYVRKPEQPVPIVDYSPREPRVNETVTFNASRSYDPDDWIIEYIWDFGDGSTVTGNYDNATIVYHKYSSPGIYTVKLIVIDKTGNHNTATTTITVAPLTLPMTTPTPPTLTITTRTTTTTQTTTTQTATTTTQATTTSMLTNATPTTMSFQTISTTSTTTSSTPPLSSSTTTLEATSTPSTIPPTTSGTTQPSATPSATTSTISGIWTGDFLLLAGLIVVAGVFFVTALLLGKKRRRKPGEGEAVSTKPSQPPPPSPPRVSREAAKTTLSKTSIGFQVAGIPGYELLEEIGRGGFSVVYKARRTSDGLIVALKIPKIQLDETLGEKMLESFLREAEVWSKLKHKYIVMVYDYGLEPVPYIAVEYMDAGSLRKKLLEKERLSLEEALGTALMIGEALSYAHHNGVVHRDIKPENVLYNKLGDAKLTDFGIAKVLLEASTRTSSKVFKGTLLYAAPEQIDPETYGGSGWRTDIWQYGALLYEMLTGKPPFQADNPATLISMILYKQPPPPSIYNPEIPRELDEIIMKCLAKRKEERWKTIELVLERLEDIRKQLSRK